MENFANASTDLERLLLSRRSIRIFSDGSVDEKALKKAFELALLSPSSSNLQPWQFIRIRGLRNEINQCFLNQSAAVSAPELIVVAARPDLWRSANSKLLTGLLASGSTKPPHFDHLTHYYGRIVPFGHDRGTFGIKGFIRYTLIHLLGIFQPVVREGYRRGSLRERAVKSTALACQTFLLALAAQGYDSCPMEGFDSKRLRKILGLPRDAALVMGIAIGKRHSGYTPPLRVRFQYADSIMDFR